jgi:hypothetical protein
LQKTLDIETVDKDWAFGTEKKIEDVFQSDLFQGTNLFDIQCHSTIYKFEVEHNRSRIPGSHHSARPEATVFAGWDSCGWQHRRRNTRDVSSDPDVPEEPDVRPTSPVLLKLEGSGPLWLLDRARTAVICLGDELMAQMFVFIRKNVHVSSSFCPLRMQESHYLGQQ